MEEIGEVARALNRLYKYQEGESKEDQRLNLAHELVDAFWFLVKIANDSGEIENRSLVLQAGSFPGYAGDDPVG
jgi:NTP pyrophosphatase (non-canonical NTP hydrolase)